LDVILSLDSSDTDLCSFDSSTSCINPLFLLVAKREILDLIGDF